MDGNLLKVTSDRDELAFDGKLFPLRMANTRDHGQTMAETATRISWKFENGQLIIQVHRSL